ncbi:MAG TPA: DinB family protein [Chitinophagaceae bacterium]
MARPQPGDYAAYYETYVGKVNGDSVAAIIDSYSTALMNFYSNLPESKGDYRYAEGKWTVKELFQHVIDTERIFSYRALRIARADQTALASFDENAYAASSDAANRSMQSLRDEFAAVRRSTDIMLSSFSDRQLSQRGTASNQAVTVNALAFIMFGHLVHHKQVLEERYL